MESEAPAERPAPCTYRYRALGRSLRRNRFEVWLEHYRPRLETRLAAALRREQATTANELDESTFHNAYIEYVWPRLESQVRNYAIRGIAAERVRSHMGDPVALLQPKPSGRRWCVPISVVGNSAVLGFIEVDEDGEVVPTRTTNREHLLRKLNEAGPRHTAATK